MIERTHFLLEGITNANVDETIEYMKLIQQRTRASIDQIDAELSSSQANAYNTSYIRTAGLGTAIALIDDPEEKHPVPLHLVECQSDRHILPSDTPFNLIEAWREWLTEKKDESSVTPFLSNFYTEYIIRHIPVYTPVNALHRTINESLIRGAGKFAEATSEIERLFERRDALAAQYNAAVFGGIAATIRDGDDGTSEIDG